jgi:hypothetical protein
MPFLAWGEVLYYNQSGGVMSGPYGFHWSPYEAAALNLIAGQRACCGNYNSPSNIGVFLQDLPQSNHLRIVDRFGEPRTGADVRVYRAVGDSGSWYGKTIDNTPDLYFTADGDGYIHMPRNPFSDGGIEHTYGIANGVAVLRIEHDGQIWYRFLEVTDFNMEYWRGNTQDAYYEMAVEGDETLAGDVDDDGDVDLGDLARLLGAYGTCTGDSQFNAQADFDENGCVELTDLAVLLSNYGYGT